MGALLARPLPPRAGAGGGAGHYGVLRLPGHTCPPQDADLHGVGGGPPANPRDPEDIPGPLALRGVGGRGSPGLTAGVELGASGVGDPCKLAWALLGGHALPAGVLVEPLGTDAARLALGGHLQGDGQQRLGGAPTFLPDRLPASTLLCAFLSANPPLPQGRLWCLCVTAGLLCPLLPLPKVGGPTQSHRPRSLWGQGRRDGARPRLSWRFVDIVSWPRERLWASTTGTSTVLCSGDRPLGSAWPLARPSLTQAVPVASIWHVGAQAAPNLFSEDWLQDWKVLGAEQDAAGKGTRVRRARGPQHTSAQATASVRHIPRSICGCPRQLSRPLTQ